MENAKTEKNFYVRILFDRQESNTFGLVGAQGVTLLLDEAVKDTVVDHFLKQESVITVTMSDSLTRYINTRNILYIDVSEVVKDDKESIGN